MKAPRFLSSLPFLAAILWVAQGASTVSATPQFRLPYLESAPVARVDDPSVDQLRNAKEAALSNDSLDAETRNSVAALYDAAIAELEAYAGFEAQVAQLEATKAGVPAATAAARAELAKEPLAPIDLGVDSDTPLTQLEAGLGVARAEMESLEAARTELDREPQVRAERTSFLQGEIPRLRQEFDRISSELAAPVATDDPVAEATRARLEAQRLRVDAEIRSLDAEMQSIASRAELLPLRRELASRRLAEAKRVTEAWRLQVEKRRETASTAAKSQAQQAEARVEEVPEELRELARGVAELAAEHAELLAEIELQDLAQTQSREDLAAAEQALAAAKERSDVAGLTRSVGRLLRRQQSQLPKPRDMRRRLTVLETRATAVQVENLDLEDLRTELAEEGEAHVSSALAAVEAPAERERLAERGRALIAEQRELVDVAIEAQEELLTRFAKLRPIVSDLLERTTEFNDFVGERILWIESSGPLWSADFARGVGGLRWLASPGNWTSVGRTLWLDLQARPLGFGLLLVGLIAYAAMQRRIRQGLREAGDLAAKLNCMTIRPTLRALFLSAVLTVTVPAAIWFLGWRLATSYEVGSFAKSIGYGLRYSAVILVLVQGVRVAFRSGGLGEAHFAWSATKLRAVRRNAWVLAAIAAPAYLVARALEAQSEEAWKDVVGRGAFLVVCTVFALFFKRALSRDPSQSGVRAGAGRLLNMAAVGVPLVLAGMSIFGFGFTALELFERHLYTIGLVLVFGLANGFVTRWLIVVRRRAARQRLLDRRRELMEQGKAESEIPVETEVLNIEEASDQSRQLLRSVVTLSMLLGLWFIWLDVLPALGFLNRYELWSVTGTSVEVAPDGTESTVIGTTPISLGNLVMALLVLGAMLLAAKNVPGVLEVSVLQRLSIGAGERYAISTLARYAILLFGIVTAFGAIGVGWGKVQWLAAAISVGLGFGLQEIFANFVSGLIILFERPVRVGDYVTVGDTDGRVTKIRMRATTITDWDLRELLVPNREFITQRLVNWTLSNPITRVVLPVGVAYGSDTDRARQMLLDIARRNRNVMRDPGPSVLFAGFKDSSLDLQLRVFIENRDLFPELVTSINTEIHEGFADAGIEIAFPQRDLNIRSAEPLIALLKRHPAFSVQEIGSSGN